jgi:hypothetical protein
MTGVELAGVLIKPVYYLWQLVKGLLPKKDDDTFRVPKRTLILIPDTPPYCPAMDAWRKRLTVVMQESLWCSRSRQPTLPLAR